MLSVSGWREGWEETRTRFGGVSIRAEAGLARMARGGHGRQGGGREKFTQAERKGGRVGATRKGPEIGSVTPLQHGHDH